MHNRIKDFLTLVTISHRNNNQENKKGPVRFAFQLVKSKHHTGFFKSHQAISRFIHNSLLYVQILNKFDMWLWYMAICSNN